jgi:carbamate kinase
MIVVTLGGNAIVPGHGKGTIEEQIAVTRRAMSGVAALIERGVPVILSHGNGPIVGNIVVRNEVAKDRIAPMPLDVCGADSQGGIGYMLQQTLGNELAARGISRTVAAMVTQCVVDPKDPAFGEPSKPIGPYYSRQEADFLTLTKGWILREESGRRYRRVVASPRPLEIVEWRAIESLSAAGIVVIAAGGGGVPVVREPDGRLRGVEAVVDKDRSAVILARHLRAKRMAVLTAVHKVAVDFGKPTQRNLDVLTLSEGRRLYAEGQFPPGSMGPKVEACLEFLESGGEEAIITSAEHFVGAAFGEAGTRIVRDGAGPR